MLAAKKFAPAALNVHNINYRRSQFFFSPCLVHIFHRWNSQGSMSTSNQLKIFYSLQPLYALMLSTKQFFIFFHFMLHDFSQTHFTLSRWIGCWLFALCLRLLFSGDVRSTKLDSFECEFIHNSAMDWIMCSIGNVIWRVLEKDRCDMAKGTKNRIRMLILEVIQDE